ncbi:hypothetical protein A0H81_06883 [Grifola frondosa]|uniref:Uncharacterized protein n=1 Tax=Grifola frondosa TaxID=5627 RepID=A0A1C7M7D9_GRIFR|nr:hypothetical protein A0H81_06883 [Grifola frondosa]
MWRRPSKRLRSEIDNLEKALSEAASEHMPAPQDAAAPDSPTMVRAHSTGNPPVAGPSGSAQRMDFGVILASVSPPYHGEPPIGTRPVIVPHIIDRSTVTLRLYSQKRAHGLTGEEAFEMLRALSISISFNPDKLVSSALQRMRIREPKILNLLPIA